MKCEHLGWLITVSLLLYTADSAILKISLLQPYQNEPQNPEASGSRDVGRTGTLRAAESFEPNACIERMVWIYMYNFKDK